MLTIDIQGRFLESPVNFSGPKSHFKNCDPLILKNLAFYYDFKMRKEKFVAKFHSWKRIRQFLDVGNFCTRNRPERRLSANFWFPYDRYIAAIADCSADHMETPWFATAANRSNCDIAALGDRGDRSDRIIYAPAEMQILNYIDCRIFVFAVIVRLFLIPQ